MYDGKAGGRERRIQLEKSIEGFNQIFFNLNGSFIDVHSLYNVVFFKYLVINKKECVDLMCLTNSLSHLGEGFGFNFY